MAELWRLAPRRVAEFDAAAVAYDTYRPRYPAAVFDQLMAHVGGTGGISVVEVGAGTGIATTPLVERGLRVTAIEPSPAMAAIVKAKLGSWAEVRTERFEDWVPASTVDVVASFNSWHWVEPTIGIEKVVEVLRPGGVFALMWTDVICYGQKPFERRLLEELGWRPVQMFERVTGCLATVDRDERFVGPVVARHRFANTLDARSYIEVSRTYGASLGAVIDARVQGLINAEFGGRVEKVEEAVLFLYQRRDVERSGRPVANSRGSFGPHVLRTRCGSSVPRPK